MTTIICFWTFLVVAIIYLVEIISRLVNGSDDKEGQSLPVLLCWLVICVLMALDCLDDWKQLNMPFVQSIWMYLIILVASVVGLVLSVKKVLAIHKSRGMGKNLRYGNSRGDIFIFIIFILASVIAIFFPDV